MEIKNRCSPFIPVNCEEAGLKLNSWIKKGLTRYWMSCKPFDFTVEAATVKQP